MVGRSAAVNEAARGLTNPTSDPRSSSVTNSDLLEQPRFITVARLRRTIVTQRKV
jgi:hypothetical protein